MSRLKQLFAVSGLALLSFALMTCKPIPYYLEKVCKAYGTVTDASTGLPLESVEVSVAPYEYSELTNGLGDYELELAEGAWELGFAREGYEPFSISVTVDKANPRVQADAALTPIVPPPPDIPSIVGVWVARDLWVGAPSPIDLQMSFNADDTFQDLAYDDIDSPTRVLQSSGTASGTYVVTPDIIVCTITMMYMGTDWVVLDPPATQSLAYALSGNELTLQVDSNWDGMVDATWTLTRQ